MKLRSQVTKTRFHQPSKMQFIKIALITISLCSFIAACKKTSDSDKVSENSSIDCSGPTKTFSVDVQPIIQASCGSCHGTGSTNGVGPLTNYSQVFNARAAIRSAVISGEMPQNGRLSHAEKNSIICWIDNGALNN